MNMGKPVEITINRTRIVIVQGDITEQATDAIVNAANSGLMGGGGVDGAIHRAGGPAILAECKEIVARQGRLPAGKAVITTGGNLKAACVIHTVGPVWRGGMSGEPEILASAWRESLQLADSNGLTSIAFPSISTGVYGYPVVKASAVAMETINTFFRNKATTIQQVVIVLFDTKTYNAYAERIEHSGEERQCDGENTVE